MSHKEFIFSTYRDYIDDFVYQDFDNFILLPLDIFEKFKDEEETLDFNKLEYSGDVYELELKTTKLNQNDIISHVK